MRQLSVLAQSTNARPPLSIDCISNTSYAQPVLTANFSERIEYQEPKDLISLHKTKEALHSIDAQEEPHWKTREEHRGRDEECRSAGAYLLDFRRRKFLKSAKDDT